MITEDLRANSSDEAQGVVRTIFRRRAFLGGMATSAAVAILTACGGSGHATNTRAPLNDPPTAVSPETDASSPVAGERTATANAATKPATISAPNAPAPMTSIVITASTKVAVIAANPLALGAYIDSAPEYPRFLDQFIARVKTPPAIVMWYQDWAYPDKSPFNLTNVNEVVGHGAMPFISWEPRDHVGGVNQPKFALRTIIGGVYDPFIQQWARDAAAWGRPLYVRFAHEMNGDWYSWSPGVNGNTSAEYVASWRHVVDIFRQEGAVNVRWVWSPTGLFERSTPLAEVYPGDDYVDWLGPNAYNWGTSREWTKWIDLTTVMGQTYDVLTRLTDKPMVIAEMAAAERGGIRGRGSPRDS